MYPVEEISAATGIGAGNLALLSYLLLAYPIAIVYRILFFSTSLGPDVRNFFVVVTGLLAAYWFHQGDWLEFVHPFATTIGTWTLLKVVELTGLPRSVGGSLGWIFNIGYLFVGYYYFASDEYYINWLMPQCVLCLRLIGLAMDFQDGGNKKKESSAKKGTSAVTESDHPLENLPSLLRTIGFTYYFGGWLIGPQFPYVRYSRWLDGTLYTVTADPKKTDGDPQKAGKSASSLPPGSLAQALYSFLLGVAYLAVCQVAAGYFPTSYMTTKEFVALPFVRKFGYAWVAGKFALEKYLGVWILTEGPNAITGIAFDGVDPKTGRGYWSGLRNIDPLKFEFPWSLQQIVESFNINTNNWSKIYVYKRLRFLGSKDLSGIATVMFLAAWHGFHIGYFVTFALEWFDMEAERKIRKRLGEGIYESLSKSTSFGGRLLFGLYRVLCFFLATSVLYFGAVSFDLLQWHSIVAALSALLWWSPIADAAVFASDLLLSLLRIRLPTEKKKVQKIGENGVAGAEHAKEKAN
ncbi:MBOAT-domain-containing protein [Gonapodya prolifera JEL478]|uniref:Lysophospholipid acyltransferase 5 n=1 Tax=Gonapodya prolifera (strain JEL478) TaxID=1344416 RepID=A0A139A1H1_GONPJ|nr:MBOAT-domain-containing protein [Gonapodya prolifera JEL478]|eukprot:KXS10602.1 MBOAT-domain-containing protein [Gonapodya prolifera JEL478]